LIFLTNIQYNKDVVQEKVLLLNASYEPVHIVSWQKALQLLYLGKVEVLEESHQIVRSITISIKIPIILRLVKYIQLEKRKSFIRFSRMNVLLRDNFQCQYCNTVPHKPQLTLDHVVPVSQGGKRTWDNIVTSCIKCNQKKGGRTPEQAGMKLRQKPKPPKNFNQSSLFWGITQFPESWKIYFHSL